MSGTQNGRSPRSVALVGPYSSGKSTLFEALMEAAGTPVKRAADPRNRPATTEIRLGHCSYLGDPWTVLDCPGSVEFAYETSCALAMADLAVVVCEPAPARALTVAPLLKQLADEGMPHILFINKIDTLEGSVSDTLAALQGYATSPLVLRQVPIMHGETVSGYVDVVSERAYRYRKGEASELMQIPSEMHDDEQEALNKLVEVLADRDDALLEKVLEDVKPTTAEIYNDLRKDLAAGAVIEVLLGSAENAGGVRRLWKALRHDTPTAAETAARKDIVTDGPPLAQVFKTVHAGHTGKLSYARIWRGQIKDGATLGGTRLGGIYRMPGGELAKIAEAARGRDCRARAIGWRADRRHGFARRVAGSVAVPRRRRPRCIRWRSRRQTIRTMRSSAARCRSNARRIRRWRWSSEQDTSETVLYGQGEMHLNSTVERLRTDYGLKVNDAQAAGGVSRKRFAAPVHEHGRLKKQSGGHGQFADVKIDIAPRERGEGFAFIDKIVGGAVPRNFIPAVAEAAEESAKKGPFGFPVVDISVTLVDGGFHSVDSSDMAFKTATSQAMKEGLAKAEPILLEPVDHVTISVPNEFTPRAQRLLTGRRGQILGFAEKDGWPGWDDVVALVPEAELHDLIIELRSQTLGLGTYRRKFDHLAESRAEVRRGAA